MRTESDFLGAVQINKNALYGIHSWRAKNNFPDTTPFHLQWYKAAGLVKLACYETYKSYKSALLAKHNQNEIPFQFIDESILNALIQSATDVSKGKHFEWFIVPAIQGGAGTSINMNVNEIIANQALNLLGKNAGEYAIIDPIEHANIYQSTNDVIPTSLKLVTIQLLVKLEDKINQLRASIETLEKQHHNSVRIGYTQMQEAVPSSYGRLFGAYNDALSRDWWRVSKCFERIKTVNLGGSAIGTGITVPRFFIMEVVQHLQRISGLPITRAENMCDATSNLDSFVEVHAILKAHAVNLIKIANDIRLLASDVGSKEISIPQKQVGSSIMPGKINPVIPEFTISACHKVFANDSLISALSAEGCLELNAYLPSIGHSLIDSLQLLIAANESLQTNLFLGLEVITSLAEQKLHKSVTLVTALVPFIGYNKASELAKLMKNKQINIFEANHELQLIDNSKLLEILKPENLLKEGFTLSDLQNSGISIQ
jgi:aspartate ammonia-lyase